MKRPTHIYVLKDSLTGSETLTLMKRETGKVKEVKGIFTTRSLMRIFLKDISRGRVLVEVSLGLEVSTYNKHL